jgi:hypothetical protein
VAEVARETSNKTSHNTKVCVFRGTTFNFDSRVLPHEIKYSPPFIYYYNNFARKELSKVDVGINVKYGTRVKISRFVSHVGMLLYAGMWKFDGSGDRILAM